MIPRMPEPCLCGADDCPLCRPGIKREIDEEREQAKLDRWEAEREERRKRTG